jgi:hypothetical protein
MVQAILVPQAFACRSHLWNRFFRNFIIGYLKLWPSGVDPPNDCVSAMPVNKHGAFNVVPDRYGTYGSSPLDDDFAISELNTLHHGPFTAGSANIVSAFERESA